MHKQKGKKFLSATFIKQIYSLKVVDFDGTIVDDFVVLYNHIHVSFVQAIKTDYTLISIISVRRKPRRK